MSCNTCIRGDYDFIIKEIDTKSLLYQDWSTWQEGSNFCKPETYLVTVYPPGSQEPVVLNLSTTSLNKITPEHFGGYNALSKIQDGVYYFSIEEGSEGYCGKIFRKSVAIIPSLQCCFDRAFMKYALYRKEEIKHIEFLIRSVRLHALVGNIQMSDTYYDMAKSALTKMDCDCSF